MWNRCKCTNVKCRSATLSWKGPERTISGEEKDILQTPSTGSTGCQPAVFPSTQLPAAALGEALTHLLLTPSDIIQIAEFSLRQVAASLCLKTCCCGVYTNVLMCKVTWGQITRNWDVSNDCSQTQGRRRGGSLHRWIDAKLKAFLCLPRLLGWRGQACRSHCAKFTLAVPLSPGHT